jgi:hypothetical protein
MAAISKHIFNIEPYGKNVYKKFPLKSVSQFKANMARPSWLEVGITGHNFGRGPSKNHFSKVWLRLAK